MLTNRGPPQFGQVSASSLDVYDHLPAIPGSLDGWNAIDSTALGSLDPGNATSSSLALNSPSCSQWPADPLHFSHGTSLLDQSSYPVYCDTDVYPSPPTTVNSSSRPKWQPVEGASPERHRKKSLPLMAPGVPNPFANSGAVALPQSSNDHWERQIDCQLYSTQPQYSTIDSSISPSAPHRQYSESTFYQSPTSNLPGQSMSHASTNVAYSYASTSTTPADLGANPPGYGTTVESLPTPPGRQSRGMLHYNSPDQYKHKHRRR